MTDQPYMQLWIADFLGDTLHLTSEEIGQYMLLLMAMWRFGGYLQDDATKLARVARGPVSEAVMSLFTKCPETGTLYQKRLQKELALLADKRRKRAEAGKLGGNAKAKALKNNKSVVANGLAKPCHLPESESYKEKDGAKAPYRFSGKIIRLNEEDFERWKQSFSRVELVGYLEARDVFLSELPLDDSRRKKWMTSTSADLRNKNAVAKARAPVSVAQAAEGWRQEAEKQIAARDVPVSAEERARRIKKAEETMQNLRRVS